MLLYLWFDLIHIFHWGLKCFILVSQDNFWAILPEICFTYLEVAAHIQNETGAVELVCSIAIRVVEFSSGGTKLERFLHKNQHTQRKLLNLENGLMGRCQKLNNLNIISENKVI